MRFYIEPTQMDEWRRKHRTRIFLEERLLDLRDVFLVLLSLSEQMFSKFKLVKVDVPRSKSFWGAVVGMAALAFVMLY